MIQIQLINSLIEWERRLVLDEERRKYHRSDPYVNYLAAPQTCRKEEIDRKENRKAADLVKAMIGDW
jgi:hypothetical protein